MYTTNRHIPTIAALVLGILFTISPAMGDTTLLDENFDSYPDGAWPTGFYQFGYDYDYYGGNDVVSGVIPACPSEPKCFMTTNPFPGWGNDISVPFSWTPSSYNKLIWSAAVMLPLNSSGNDDAKLELIISPFDRQRICGFGLQEVDIDQINIVYNSPTGMQILGTGYHNDQWISLRGELDISTETYDVYVNDILLGDDLSILPGRTVSEIGAVFLGKGFWESNSAYYDDVLVLGETTAPALSGWVFMLPDIPDIGYSLDEGDLLCFFSFDFVQSYNITVGEWFSYMPMGWIYVDWPFYYESDTDVSWFALPPEFGLWVYHFSTGEWEQLPRIIP